MATPETQGGQRDPQDTHADVKRDGYFEFVMGKKNSNHDYQNFILGKKSHLCYGNFVLGKKSDNDYSGFVMGKKIDDKYSNFLIGK